MNKKLEAFTELETKKNGILKGGFLGLNQIQMKKITGGSNTEGCHGGCHNTGDCSHGTNTAGGSTCTNVDFCAIQNIK